MPSWRRQWLPQLQLGEKIHAFPEGLALFLNKVVDMPVVCMSWCACRVGFLPWCRGRIAWSSLCVGHGVRCPCCSGRVFVYFPVVAQRRLPMVFVTIESPQFSCWQGDRRPCCEGRASWWGPGHRHRARVDPRHQGGEGVAGMPGVLTPRCSATRIDCMLIGMSFYIVCTTTTRTLSAQGQFSRANLCL